VESHGDVEDPGIDNTKDIVGDDICDTTNDNKVKEYDTGFFEVASCLLVISLTS
jgi:hypothetical protein